MLLKLMKSQGRIFALPLDTSEREKFSSCHSKIEVGQVFVKEKFPHPSWPIDLMNVVLFQWMKCTQLRA
jgi:hypothetical protein